MGWFPVTFSPPNTSRGSKHDNKLRGARSHPGFCYPNSARIQLTRVAAEIHLYFTRFLSEKKKIRQPHYFPSYLKTRGDELIQPLSAHPSFTFSQTFAGPWPPMLTGQQQFQYLPWVLSLHTHTRVSAPAAPACWVSFFLKLRFMQSSGTQNECRVNLSRHQSGWKKRSFRRYCYFF